MSQMTVAKARSAEACEETDWACVRTMGWRYDKERRQWFRPDGEAYNTMGPLPEKPVIKPTRSTNGAHKVRQYILSEIDDASLRMKSSQGSHKLGLLIGDAEDVSTFSFAMTEHLASSRLLLLLAAQGYVDTPDEYVYM